MKLKIVKINGIKYPIHFGMNALLEIGEKLNVAADDILSSLNISTLKSRLTLAHIGLLEGARLAGLDNVPAELTAFCDLIDHHPEAREEIIGVYYLQTFGKSIDAIIKEAEKTTDDNVKEAADHLKKVWPMLTDPAKKLASADFTK